MQQIRTLCRLLLFSITGFGITNAQQFDLIEPGGIAVGTVTIELGALTYQEPGGPIFLYRRDRNFDTRDGRYIGYYNVALARVIKFPATGTGHFFSADFDDPFPVDQRSSGILRPRQPSGSGALGGQNPIGPYQNSQPYRNPGLGLDLGLGGVPSPRLGYGGPNRRGPNAIGPLLPGLNLPRPTIPNLIPPQTNIQTSAVPLPELEPVTIQLVNGGPRDINVTLTDQLLGKTFSKRIKVGQQQPMTLQRDAGQQVEESFQTIGPLGNSFTEQRNQYVPPPIRYEITVHQWRVQSVSIDRTAPGGDKIDDVNIQGQAVGSFFLPPGPDLVAGTIDVYRTAQATGNQNSIAPLVPQQDLPSENVSPLEKAILDLR